MLRSTTHTSALKTFQSWREGSLRKRIRGNFSTRVVEANPAVLPLLCSFHRHGHRTYSLLFPWPTGSVASLYRAHPKGLDSASQTLIWMVSQCWGLADCLAHVHRNEVRSKDRGPKRQLAATAALLKYTIINPSNIWWYCDSGETQGGGRLVLSDFPLRESGYHPRFAYAAPEIHAFSLAGNRYPVRHGFSRFGPGYREVWRKGHIWSLGCVWVELATWYILRSDSVALEPAGYYDIPGRDTTAVITDRIRSLHQHENCSLYLHRFLSFVEQRMLVADPGERATAAEVAKHMGNLRDQLQASPELVLQGSPCPAECNAYHRSGSTPPASLHALEAGSGSPASARETLAASSPPASLHESTAESASEDIETSAANPAGVMNGIYKLLRRTLNWRASPDQ